MVNRKTVRQFDGFILGRGNFRRNENFMRMILNVEICVILINLFCAACVNETRYSIEITKFGENKTLNCGHQAIYWKRNQTDIFDGFQIIHNKTDKYELLNTSGQNDLLIKYATFKEAGLYRCQSVMTLIPASVVIVIVIDGNVTCDFPSGMLQNEKLTINCSINFSSNDTCKDVPLLVDEETGNSITTGTGRNKEHMWLIVDGNNLQHFIKLSLKVLFTCNVTGTFCGKHHKVVELIYSTKYIYHPIIANVPPQISSYVLGSFIAVFLIVLLLLLFVIALKNTNRQESPIRNRPLPSIPDVRRFIRYSINSISGNTLRNNRRTTDTATIVPYWTSFEFSPRRDTAVLRAEVKSAKSMERIDETPGTSDYKLESEMGLDDFYEGVQF